MSDKDIIKLQQVVISNQQFIIEQLTGGAASDEFTRKMAERSRKICERANNILDAQGVTYPAPRKRADVPTLGTLTRQMAEQDRQFYERANNILDAMGVKRPTATDKQTTAKIIPLWGK